MKLDIGKSFEEVVKGQQIVGTVQKVSSVEFDDRFHPGQKRSAVVVNFAEYGDNGWFPSRAALKIIIKVLGDETDEWEGHAIPLQRIKTPDQTTGEIREKFHPMNIDVWDQAVKAYNSQLREARGKKTAGKR